MEKTMSVEDKIRRAEEIYNRRQEKNYSYTLPKISNQDVKKDKKNIRLFRKLILQMLICLIIYFTFYIIKNNNYVFSEDFINKSNEILSQDIDLKKLYFKLGNFVSGIFEKINNLTNNEVKTENNEEQIENDNQNENANNENIEQQSNENNDISQNNGDNNNNVEKQQTEENIGGAIVEENNTNISQMEQDANYIKSTVSFIKPISGTISSGFGTRNPTTVTVPTNHTGTDIAAVKGTKIVSATDGVVILNSSKGDYGKHLKIQINDITVIYAHCNDLYVKEGDIIKQGQEIAEVGSTGNSTGPHLHFEVRLEDRYVNPQLILDL